MHSTTMDWPRKHMPPALARIVRLDQDLQENRARADDLYDAALQFFSLGWYLGVQHGTCPQNESREATTYGRLIVEYLASRTGKRPEIDFRLLIPGYRDGRKAVAEARAEESGEAAREGPSA